MKNLLPWTIIGLAVIVAVFIWSPIFGNEPTEIRIETKNVRGKSTFTYGSVSSKAPKAGTQHAISFGTPFLETKMIYFRRVYIYMNGFYEAKITLFLKGKLCGSANLINTGAFSEHRVDCVEK